ncbi:hypothetical protein N658DRAFT_509481 [Parathielavia hyrcaniae]|uniref:Uncharacterized protein n=1 Tax=Parathielavia hyrcaniae TaxID=113614 RepID=A0AAN6SYV9_9PEZI|nr:hypothetical protein N658DRAFT_509481 [Parathielavia hyrcaniae]
MAPRSFPQFHALPAEIQRHVFDLAAPNAAADETDRNLISTTDMEVARLPLLALCPESRAAVIAKEAFQVTTCTLPWDSGNGNMTNNLPLPLHGGATQDLVMDIFPGLIPESQEKEIYQAAAGQSPPIGEFEDGPSRGFSLQTVGSLTGSHREPFGEMVRRYPDGRTLVNSGLRNRRAGGEQLLLLRIARAVRRRS